MDNQISGAVRSLIDFNKVISSAKGAETALQALYILKLSVAAKAQQIEPLHSAFPNICS